MYIVDFRGQQSHEGQGLGIDRPGALNQEDDEFEAYRKRMMLAYRFRPNPLVSIKSPLTTGVIIDKNRLSFNRTG